MSYSKRAGDTEDPRLEELEQLHWDPIVDWFGQVTAMATIRDHRLSNKSIHLVDHVHNTHADIWRNESESWLRAGECLKLSKHHLGKRARDIYPHTNLGSRTCRHVDGHLRAVATDCPAPGNSSFGGKGDG